MIPDLYRPHPKQCEAHAASEAAVLYAGGYGSGKSWWLVRDMLAHFARGDGPSGVLVAPTYRLLHSVLTPALLATWPGARRWPRGRDKVSECLGPLVRDWSSQEHVLTLWGGQRLYLRSADSPGQIEGLSVSVAGMDEPRLVPHEVWQVLVGRVREGRRQRIMLSGVPAAPWIREEFGGASRERGVPGEVPGRRLVQCSTRDNPHLRPSPEAYIAAMRMSSARARCYVEGGFASYEGAVYAGEYADQADGDDPGSLVECQPDPGRMSWGALDYGYRRPVFLLVQDVDGVDVVVWEVVASNLPEGAHALRVADVCRRFGLVLQDVYADPAGGAVNTQTGVPAMRIYEGALKAAGVLRGAVRSAPRPGDAIARHVPNGVEAVRARFLGRDGRRRLFVARHLSTVEYPDGIVGIHRSLLGYVYPSSGVRDEPVKDGVHDHCPDALRYYVLGRYGLVDVVGTPEGPGGGTLAAASPYRPAPPRKHYT